MLQILVFKVAFIAKSLVSYRFCAFLRDILAKISIFAKKIIFGKTIDKVIEIIQYFQLSFKFNTEN